MNTEPAYDPIHRVFEFWRGDRFSRRHFGAVFLGCERQTDPALYRWEGMRRGADPAHPGLIFQYTLEGRGAFEQGGRKWAVGKGSAFVAIAPSEHVYYLPAEVPQWAFFWFTFAHPFVVERVRTLLREYEPVFAIGGNSQLMAKSLAFYEKSCMGRFEDRFEEEAALLDWTLALERHLYNAAHPQAAREEMLQGARRFTSENMGTGAGVEELAREHGLSRSHYSRNFRKVTGISPAAFMLAERLKEACRLLRDSAQPLKEIAEATGFADANHLCKVFRREMHISPGSLRRQIGGRS